MSSFAKAFGSAFALAQRGPDGLGAKPADPDQVHLDALAAEARDYGRTGLPHHADAAQRHYLALERVGRWEEATRVAEAAGDQGRREAGPGKRRGGGNKLDFGRVFGGRR